MRTKLAIASLCAVLILAALGTGHAVRIVQPGGSSASLAPFVIPATALTNASSPYTVQAADSTFNCDPTAGNVVINLPAATGSHRVLTLINSASGSVGGNDCHFVPNGTDLIGTANANLGVGACNATCRNMSTTIYDSVAGAWAVLVPPSYYGNNTVTYSSGAAGGSQRTFTNSWGAGITFAAPTGIGNDNLVSTMARMPLNFPISAVAATTTTQWGETKLVKAITIENVVFNVGAFTCSVNPAISLLDCSAIAGTCTPVSTLATSGTLTGIGSTNAATTPTANVAAGEYIAAEFTAGTCTVFNGSVQAMARPQ